MNVRTNLHSGQNGTLDPAKLAQLVQELDCQMSPFEMLALANKHCKNMTPAKLSEIMGMLGGL